MNENPITFDGPPDGPGAAQPLPGAPVPAVAQRDGPGEPDAALQAHLTGEPGSLLPVWCKVCEAEVRPEGKGRCPRCQTFLRRNFAARRHPQNKLRCQQILDKLVVDYEPSTTMTMATCEHLSAILEQLELLRPGTPDHQRLVLMSQSLAGALEASRPTRTPSERPGLEGVPASSLHLAKRLLERQVAGEVLTAFEEGQLSVLTGAMNGTITLPPDPPHAFTVPANTRGEQPEPDTVETITPANPVAEPSCRFGCGSLAKCAELKTTRRDVWEALHSLDPEVIQEKNERATKVMMSQIGKPSPWL
jgi:hypothetical protein